MTLFGGAYVHGGAPFDGTSTNNITIANATPTLTFSDTTASAKDALFKVDSDKLYIQEAAGADGSRLTIGLGTTPTLSIGTTSTGGIFTIFNETLDTASLFISRFNAVGSPLMQVGEADLIGSAATYGGALFHTQNRNIAFAVENVAALSAVTTTALFIEGTGDIGIGTEAPGIKLDVKKALTENTGTFIGITDTTNSKDAKLGVFYVTADTSYPGVWFNQGTPSITNYTFLSDSGTSILNAVAGKSVLLRINNATKATLDSNGDFSVANDSIRITTSQTPASNGTGTTGEIAWDADYIYVCTNTDTWERAALTGGY